MDLRLYLRQVLVLLSGAAAAQLINLASYPLLTRLYTPHDFGVFALFLTVTGIIGPVAAGRFDLIVQSAKDRELAAVFRVSQIVNVAISVLSTLAFMIYAAGSDQMGVEHAILLGIVIFLTGFGLSSSAFLVRHERYRASAQSAVLRTLVAVVAQILFFFIWPNGFGLIVGFCLGFVGQAIMLRAAIRAHDRPRPSPLRLKAAWARHRPQVMVDVPSTIIGALALNVLNFFLLALYSTEQVGYYSLAFRVAVLPLILFAGSLSEVFFQKASAAYRKTGTFWHELRFNILSSALISVLFFVPLIFVARPLFGIVFGAEWVPAADILLYLLPMLAVRFVSASIQTAPLVMGRPSWLFAHNAGLIVAMTVAFLIAEGFKLSLKDYLLINTALMATVYLAFTVAIAVAVHGRHGRLNFDPAPPLGAGRPD